MNAGAAKQAALLWLNEAADDLPGFRGAFLHGSILDLPDEAELPPTSDVDLIVVLDDPDRVRKPGKFRFRGVLLEVSSLASEQVRNAEQVLGEYNLAGSFRTPGILADPMDRGDLCAVPGGVRS